MKTFTRLPLIAAGVVALSAAPAAAATVTTDLNLRDGPGTNYAVIGTLPAGTSVDVDECTGNWCLVASNGYSGYASASYLADEGAVIRSAPRYAYYDYEPAPPIVSYEERPGVSFGLTIGDPYYDYDDDYNFNNY